MDERRRGELLEVWRRTRLDVQRQGEWTSLAGLPSAPLLMISAANPGLSPASQAENIQHDARLLRALVELGLDPVRARGRSGDGPAEEGWLVAHEPARSLALVRQFRQVAGLLLTSGGRSVLWADGSLSPLDDGQCRVPEARVLP